MWSHVGNTSSTAAASLQQQFNLLHVQVSQAVQTPQHRYSFITRTVRPQHAPVSALPTRHTGWQQRQQHQESHSRFQSQQQRYPESNKSAISTPQGQQLWQQQQQQLQQQSEANSPAWGYLSKDSADAWTWDDDYNKEAIAKAAAAAQQLPPTPRQVYMTAAAKVAMQQQPTVINKLPEQFNRQVLSNAVLLVDKPVRWSGADVVRQLKVALKMKRICFGVPLDMEASGLLIILLGDACRLTPKLELLERTYSGTLCLGTSTSTYDASGQTLESNPWQHVTDADVAAVAQGFVGEIQQIPCMWSSSKYKNKPLRWYAERGEVVAREPKSVIVSSIQTWRTQSEDSSSSDRNNSNKAGDGSNRQSRSDVMGFRVVAGKGTSVRVLVHDIGKALGCGAHLTSLRLEALGGFSVDTAWSLEVLLPLARKYAKGFRQFE